jgi:tetratricopeptide (TPR) repeat protein
VGRRIFLSYGHDEHLALALRMKQDLEARGHVVWFDAERLKPGADWERYIEEGLEWAAAIPQEGRVVLIMTPHSVRRPDGYCLNEVARALSRRLTVVPAMVVWCEPPLSICRVQWLDMRDCVPLDAQPGKYESKFEILAGALESGGLEFEGGFVRLFQLLEPLPFDADLLPHAARFIGRKSVLKKVEAWLADAHAPRLFWITGIPGVGKTALAAWLCQKRPEVAAFHLCSRGHTQKADPRRCVLSIAFQLASQLPDYQARLNSLNLEQITAETDARTIFDLLICQPLSGSFPRPPRDLVVVVDALDEAKRDGRNQLAALLASEFPNTPSWLRLVVTSRPSADVMLALQEFEPVSLDASSEENRQDLQDYLVAGLRHLPGEQAASPESVDRIIDRSEGLFLYVHWVLRDLQLGHLSLDRPAEFPQGLGGVYAQYFERQFPDLPRYKETLRPVLETVVAAQEPLGLDRLAAIHGWNAYQTEDVRGAFGSLFPSDDGVLKPFHGSVMEWLTSPARAGPFFISPKEGQKRLAQFIWAEYVRSGTLRHQYDVRHALTHLRLAGELAKALTLLQDDAHLAAFIRAESPDALREELYQCWAAVEQADQVTVAEDHAPAAAGMAHGLHRARNNDVQGAIPFFEAMPDQPSAVLDALRWNELCWLTKDYAPARRVKSMDSALRSLRQASRRVSDAHVGSLAAELLRSAGWMLKDLGRTADAEDAFTQACDLFAALDAARQLAWTRRDLGCLYRDSGRADLAERLFRDSEQVFRQLGDRRQLAVSLKDRGVLLLEKAIVSASERAGLGEQADALFREALELSETLKERDLTAWVLRYRGLTDGLLGRLEAARALIALSRERFEHFKESNQALCDYLADHIGQVRHPHLLELFGRLVPQTPLTYSRLLK